MDIEKVVEFARKAHGSQKRKYTEEPYVNHCIRVAEAVKKANGTEAMVCAALLHDVLEDTKTTAAEIYDFFYRESGDALFAGNVLALVRQLTDIASPADGNRKQRKAKDRQHLREACPEAKTIKLADVSDNVADIIKNDKNFARVYVPENAELIEVLKEGDPELFDRASAVIKSAKAALKKAEIRRKVIN